MSKNELRNKISKKLKDKWGYSKHQIDVYWRIKNELTIEELKNELERI